MNKVKVILVDDRKDNLFSLGTLLEELDVEVHKVQSGEKALELMLDHNFALAILDVQMPDMDGFELAELMRGAAKTQSIPIIFVTAASPASGFAFKGYERGAVDFLYKPLDSLAFKSKVKVFIELETQKILLREAKEAAENANRLKSSFLANMSHEIRTPLGAIMGFAQLLEDENVPAKEKEKYIRTIMRNGVVLTNLIDDILDLSKVEAGYLEVVNEEICGIQTVKEVLALLEKMAEHKGLKLNFKVEGNVPAKIITDDKRIRQVLTNVVGNAIKFTEKGSVDVELSSQKLSDDSSKIIIKVTDTGVGIEAKKVQKLFKPFMQADNSITRKFGGSGLGLALSKKLTELLHGDLYLEHSELNKGSRFVIHFTAQHGESLDEQMIAKRSQAPAYATATEPLEGHRILVVEDSQDNQDLMEILLHRKGAIVEFANNGLEGYKKAMSGNHDIVLMDIQMPVQDGYVTVRQLKEQNYEKPIIALTAHAMAEEREKCLRVGCVDFLSKPINQAQLIEKISFYLSAK